MQSPPAVLDLATLYLKIYFLGMPATLVYNFGAALLRASGDTQRPLNYLFLSGILNVILNLLFVIVFHMDVAGVAIATVSSQCLSAFLVVRCMLLSPGGIHLVFQHLRIHPEYLKGILRIGLPTGLQSTLYALSSVVIQSTINSFGEIVMAGSAASCSIENFLTAAASAFYQASTSFTSQSIGAGRYDRIRPILYRSLICVFVVALSLCSLTIFFGPAFLSLYTDNPAVIAAGMVRLPIIASTFVLCAILEVFVASLRGLGYSVTPMIVSLIGTCGLRLVWISTIFQLPRFHTIEMLYTSYPISWFLTMIAHAVCFLLARQKLKKQFPDI